LRVITAPRNAFNRIGALAIHYCDIDPTSAVAQAKLVQHERVGIAMMFLQHFAMQSLSHIPISHD
jgi:hypothetical protein